MVGVCVHVVMNLLGLQSPWPRLTYSSLLAATAPEIVLHSDAPVGKIMSGASQFVGTAMAHHAKTTLIQIQAVWEWKT